MTLYVASDVDERVLVWLFTGPSNNDADFQSYIDSIGKFDGICAGKDGAEFLDWDRQLANASGSFTTVDTRVEDPALLIYTSGTTGKPKGAVHAHRMMIGCIPAVEQMLSHWPRGPGCVRAVGRAPGSESRSHVGTF